MRDPFAASIDEAKEYLRQLPDSVMTHTSSVVGLAVELASNFTQVDSDVIRVAAWWHDVGRLYDENHEALSARMARESLARLGAPPPQRRTVHNAIVLHKWSMSPETIEGEILRDADKIDWVTVSRWKSWLHEADFARLDRMSESLGWIRNEVLHLEPSRAIFDRELQELQTYLLILDGAEGGDGRLRHIRRRMLAGGAP